MEPIRRWRRKVAATCLSAACKAPHFQFHGEKSGLGNSFTISSFAMCGAIRNFVRIIPGLASAGLTAVLCCSLTPCATAAGDGGEPPPVILISIDTLRADHLSSYGYGKIRTPHLDLFGRGGTLFARVDAQIP